PHVDHPGDCVGERLGREGIPGLAACARRREQPGVRERGELLRDRLPRHRETRGELRCRRVAALRNRRDEGSSCGIPERVEDEIYATATHAKACSSSAVLHSGEVSVTCSRVPPSTSSSSSTTSPSS